MTRVFRRSVDYVGIGMVMISCFLPSAWAGPEDRLSAQTNLLEISTPGGERFLGQESGDEPFSRESSSSDASREVCRSLEAFQTLYPGAVEVEMDDPECGIAPVGRQAFYTCGVNTCFALCLKGYDLKSDLVRVGLYHDSGADRVLGRSEPLRQFLQRFIRGGVNSQGRIKQVLMIRVQVAGGMSLVDLRASDVLESLGQEILESMGAHGISLIWEPVIIDPTGYPEVFETLTEEEQAQVRGCFEEMVEWIAGLSVGLSPLGSVAIFLDHAESQDAGVLFGEFLVHLVRSQDPAQFLSEWQEFKAHSPQAHHLLHEYLQASSGRPESRWFRLLNQVFPHHSVQIAGQLLRGA
ncbi:MAG: hypothetical protein ACO3A2_11250 [Bdellovibrionia bacterium]